MNIKSARRETRDIARFLLYTSPVFQKICFFDPPIGFQRLLEKRRKCACFSLRIAFRDNVRLRKALDSATPPSC